MCFGCSKESSHRDGSFEYPQHTFWWRNKKNNFQLHTLIWGPVNDLGFTGSVDPDQLAIRIYTVVKSRYICILYAAGQGLS